MEWIDSFFRLFMDAALVSLIGLGFLALALIPAAIVCFIVAVYQGFFSRQ